MPPESLPPESASFTDAVPPVERDANGPSQARLRPRHQYDELIAVVLALLGIGTVLFWVLGKNNPITGNLPFGSVVPQNLEDGDSGNRVTTPNASLEATPEANGGVFGVGNAGGSVLDDGTVSASKVQKADNPLLNALTDRQAGGASNSAAVANQTTDSTGESANQGNTPSQSTADTVEGAPANQGNTQGNAPVSQPTAVTVETDVLPPATAPRQFSDVAADSPLTPYVDALSSRGVLDQFDDGTLNPNEPISRAEFAQLVSQAFDKPRMNPAIDFSDVSAGSVNQAAIEEATRTGFMIGFPDGSFKPDLNIPRYQMQVAIVTGTQLLPSGDPVQALAGFADRNAIPSWAISKVATAINAGILPSLEPTDTTLNPAKVATRGEAIVMLHNALVKEGKLPAVE